MNQPKISLDTNVFIFGLRKLDQHAMLILKHLFRFEVSLPEQVERELRRNLAASEFRRFYELIGMLPSFSVAYQPVHDDILQLYRRFGLKTGDAKIAAFCEQEGIELFVSENRHFLRELPERSFEIVDCQKFC